MFPSPQTEKPRCGTTWAQARFQSPRRWPPLRCPSSGATGPSTSAKGPGQQLDRLHRPGCAQSRPRPPEARPDVTRADRRKEQAPRSCRTQGGSRPGSRPNGAEPPAPSLERRNRAPLAGAPSTGGSRRPGAVRARTLPGAAEVGRGEARAAVPRGVQSRPSPQPRWKLPDESVREKRAGVCSPGPRARGSLGND